MYLIGNGKLFTRDEERTYIENGGILVDGKIIKEVKKFCKKCGKHTVHKISK